MRKCFKLIGGAIVMIGSLISFSGLVLAFEGDVMLPDNHVRFSQESFMEGQTVRVYVTPINQSDRDLLGTVRITVNGKQIGSDQPVSLLSGKSDSVFIDWKVQSAGKNVVNMKVIPYEPAIDNPANNSVVREVMVVADTDRDGVANSVDSDDDNDGVSDENDAFPTNPRESKDSDKDNIGDNADDDDDNDGVKDSEDAFRLDPDESKDTDGDGIGDNADDDDDGDGLSDDEEEEFGYDPSNSDTDGDGVLDGEDAFPADETEVSDYDGDGIGDNADVDDDGDGVKDYEDVQPRNKGPIVTPSSLEVNATVGDDVVFELPEVKDDDGEITKYVWSSSEGDVEVRDQPEPYKKVFQKPGKYEVSLKVFDDKGEFRTADYQVNVFESNFVLWVSLFLITLLLALVVAIYYLRKAKKSI